MPAVFLIWAVAVFAGYGAMWLSVRGQHPYRGPAWEALLLAFLLFVAAGGAWAGVVGSLAVYALAGGVGIALMAVIEPQLRRS